MGDVPYSFKFEGERTYLTIFNTGTSFTLVPGELWPSWSDHLIQKAELAEYEIIGGFLAFGCENRNNMPHLWFMMEGYWLQMHYQDYVFDASLNGDQSVCALSIVANSQDFFLMGTSFMRGYYTIHDDRQQNGEPGFLGLIPHKTSTKDFVKEAITMPSEVLKPIAIDSIWTWAVELGLATGWVAFTGFYAHEALSSAIDSVALVTLIEGSTTGLWGTFQIMYLKPVLNTVFN